MTKTDQKKLAELGNAATQYWIAYSSYSELVSGKHRTWHDLPVEIQANLQKRTHELIKVSAEFEGILSLEKKLAPTVIPTFIAPVEPVAVKWGAKTVLIFPWLDLSSVTKDDFVSFCVNLPSNTLTLGVTPNIHSQDIGEMIRQTRKLGYPFILAAPDDIDALARHSWTISELINYKVTKIFLEEEVDVEAAYLEWQVDRFRKDSSQARSRNLLKLNSVLTKRKDERDAKIHHPDSDRLAEALRNQDFALVVGKSASGKTLLSLAVAERLQIAGRIVWYVDVGNLSSKSTYSVGLSIFREAMKSEQQIVVVLDDLHTQASLAEALIRFINFLQVTLFGNQLTVIGICWPEFEQNVTSAVHDAYILRIQANTLTEALIQKFGTTLSQNDIDKIRVQSGDDLFILRLWLENSKETQIVEANELAKRVWVQRSKNLKGKISELQRILFVGYLIGQYECDVSTAFLKSQASASSVQIDELVRSKLFVRKGEREDLLSPPHRSFAHLMVNYIGQNREIWTWLKSKGIASSSGDILVNYLESIDPSQIWSVLKLMESGGAVKSSKRSQEHIQMITLVWRSIDRLLKKLEDQQLEDPSWGNAISSAYFACQALCIVGKYEEARGSIEFIRDVYSVKDGQLEIDINKLSTVSDFNEIRKRFEVEERNGTFKPHYGLETSSDANMDLFHANWASALVLGAEAYFKELDQRRLTELAIAVEKRITKGDYFYPARVPWASARVLMGLSACGRNVENSSVVKRVATWLLKSREEGGAREGIGWLPGTDGWNTYIETTGMVIIALLAVGIPNTNPILKKAIDHLFSLKAQWTRAGNELDGAIALEAYLSLTNNWSNVRSEALYLAQWADTIALWRNATVEASKTQEQTCRAAATAAFLIKPMWATLRKDVPQLLTAFGVSEDTLKRQNTLMNTSTPQSTFEYDVAISYASENRDYVDKVARCLKRAGLNVFYDKFEQVDMWGKNLYTHLDEVYRKKARYCIMFLSEDYARKVWTNHERESAQARAFEESREYILLVRFDTTEIPGVLPTTAYIDASSLTSSKLCKLIQEKLNQ